MKISDTQMQILAAAAAHPLQRAIPPAKLPVAAREAVRKSLLAKGLIEVVALDAAGEHDAWITDAGPATYRVVAQELAEGAAAAPYGPVRLPSTGTVRRMFHRLTRRPQSPWTPSCRSGARAACGVPPRAS